MDLPDILLWGLEPEVSEDTVTLGAQGHLALLAFHSHNLHGPLPASVTSQLTLALPSAKPTPSTAPERKAHSKLFNNFQPLRRLGAELLGTSAHAQLNPCPPAAVGGGQNLRLAKNRP
ncbi:hypothetical protein P7K49_027178 [Saguinus oedipus]|uniref:Uncharacterized protein n=1 Tax=Saguinus oedipus TaxID=9490 RepID=A0ABQ9UFB2_SAGOE|nr:hypothetical protein P7K49_027178 [Saguinus oedipus]